MVKAALWVRVSDPDKQTVANQLPPLAELAERRGFEVVRTYAVESSAWRGKHHPALADLYADAQRGLFDVVIVWALDRLSREGVYATAYTLRRLALANVNIISHQEPFIEAMGEMRDVLVAFLSWVAEYESKRRSERTKAGMARSAAAGVRVGRPSGTKDSKSRRQRSDKGVARPHRRGNRQGGTGMPIGGAA